MPHFDDSLMCHVVRLEYNFLGHFGVLHITPGECCDMRGCIDLFQEIDHKVKKIHTFSGLKRDTTYVKEKKKWIAYMPSVYEQSA